MFCTESALCHSHGRNTIQYQFGNPFMGLDHDHEIILFTQLYCPFHCYGMDHQKPININRIKI